MGGCRQLTCVFVADCRNNVGHIVEDKDGRRVLDFAGDTYIWLLGNSLSAWKASRKEFLALTGPTPLLPDFAFGTWFTFWHQYSFEDATSNVSRWNADRLPLDVWGLDMNWRRTKDVQKCCDFTPWMGGKYCTNSSTPPVNCQHPNWYYDRPASDLFPNFTTWFQFVKQQKLRTYFNDHPFPVRLPDRLASPAARGLARRCPLPPPATVVSTVSTPQRCFARNRWRAEERAVARPPRRRSPFAGKASLAGWKKASAGGGSTTIGACTRAKCPCVCLPRSGRGCCVC